jgi:hypothetical protein
MLKNPFNADKDIDALVDELRKENSDAKTVVKLEAKLLIKGVATGVLYGAVVGLAAVGAIAIGRKAFEHTYGLDMEDDTLKEDYNPED